MRDQRRHLSRRTKLGGRSSWGFGTGRAGQGSGPRRWREEVLQKYTRRPGQDEGRDATACSVGLGLWRNAKHSYGQIMARRSKQRSIERPLRAAHTRTMTINPEEPRAQDTSTVKGTLHTAHGALHAGERRLGFLQRSGNLPPVGFWAAR